MKYRIGDKVKFLNSVGGGEITSFIDKKQVMVLTEDGFDVPVLIKELVPDGSGAYSTDKQSEKPQDEDVDKPDPDFNSEDNEEDELIEDDLVAFALKPGKSGSKILSYLINSSSYHIYYVISERKDADNLIFAHGSLEPNMKERLQNIIPLNIHDEIELDVSVIFYGKSFYVPFRPIHKILRFKPSDIYSGNMLIENDFFEVKTAILNIFEFKNKTDKEFENRLVSGNLAEIIAQKEGKEIKKQSVKAKREPDITEVDLHIQSITDDYKDLSSGEIVEMQMSRFKTSLETALIHNTPRIVFIHGIGAGKLKHEIRRTLERSYPHLKYQDASFKEYGYGATMVIIPQK